MPRAAPVTTAIRPCSRPPRPDGRPPSPPGCSDCIHPPPTSGGASATARPPALPGSRRYDTRQGAPSVSVANPGRGLIACGQSTGEVREARLTYAYGIVCDPRVPAFQEPHRGCPNPYGRRPSRAIRASRRQGWPSISGRTHLIATGSRPAIPAVPGLTDVGYLTSDILTVGEADELRPLPRSLVVIGAGYVALPRMDASILSRNSTR